MSKSSRRRNKRKKKNIINKYKSLLKNQEEIKKEEEKIIEPTPNEGRQDGKPDKTYERDGKHWNQEEVDHLMKSIAQGKTDQDIAYDLHRRTERVKIKRKKLIDNMLEETNTVFDKIKNEEPIEEPSSDSKARQKGFFIPFDDFINLYENWKGLSGSWDGIKDSGEEMVKMFLKTALQKFEIKKAISLWQLQALPIFHVHQIDEKPILDLQDRIKEAEDKVTDEEVQKEYDNYEKESEAWD